jgi:hypothetical protein
VLKLVEFLCFFRFKPMISGKNDRLHHQVAGEFLEYAKIPA